MAKSFSVTDIGKKRRMNQDFVFTSDEALGTLPNLYIVADGMGGHRAGDFASRFTVTESIKKLRDKDYAEEGESVRDMLVRTVRFVNEELFRISSRVEEYAGCGTTIVAAVLEGKKAHIINVGDSRLYIVGKELSQVTVDHSLVEEMILAGSLDKKRARTHPDRNVITRAVGAEKRVDVDYFQCELKEGELLLLCSDGLTSMMEDEEILSVMNAHNSLSAKGEALLQAANGRGGFDNISVVLVDPFS